MFGTSGHKARPQAGTLLSYTRCQPAHVPSQLKSFVQPRHVEGWAGHTHAFRYRGGAFAVDTQGRRVQDRAAYAGKPTHQGASLYHYVTRSTEEMQRKVKRRAGDGSGKRLETLLHHNATSTAVCTAGVAAGRALREEGWDVQRHAPLWCSGAAAWP